MVLILNLSELKTLILEASGKDGTNSSDAQSNAATDNESEHRSEGGESFTATNNEVSNAINAVTKKVRTGLTPTILRFSSNLQTQVQTTFAENLRPIG